MTLRRRLVALMVVLVTVGLAGFGLVSYSLYSHSQYQRVDSELEQFASFAGRAAAAQVANGNSGSFDPFHHSGLDGGPGHGQSLPSGAYVELRSAEGTLVSGSSQVVGCYDGQCPRPSLPGTLTDHGPKARTLTVASTDGSTSFRVLVEPVSPPGNPGVDASPGPVPTDGDEVVAAIPLSDVTRSLHRLVYTDLIVGGAILVILSITGLVVVRRGLRPLERMTGTARAIAQGDLSRRARPADSRSEVGQLGAAFNAMMANIEGAFAERDGTEARLRQFLADASHELRTPLTSIRGYAELYRMGAAPPGPELERVMDRIETHALEMGGLVEELLLLARLDQRRPPERVEVDLAVLAAEVSNDLAVTAPDRHLTFDAPGPVMVVGDPVHLRQAIGNLLANAGRHTPAGSAVEVTVTEEDGVASVMVRDHGPGLPEEGLAHAFDRFWRADASRRGTGFGLGLAIVAAVAAEHEGAAVVANAPDGGAVFTLRLPVPASHVPPSPPPTAVSAASHPVPRVI